MLLHCKICNKDKPLEQFSYWRRLEKRKKQTPATCKECFNRKTMKRFWQARDRYNDFNKGVGMLMKRTEFLPISAQTRRHIATDLMLKKEVVKTALGR